MTWKRRALLFAVLALAVLAGACNLGSLTGPDDSDSDSAAEAAGG